MKKKLNYFSAKFILSLLLILAAAYILRVGYRNNYILMYVIGVLLFAAAYFIQTRKK